MKADISQLNWKPHLKLSVLNSQCSYGYNLDEDDEAQVENQIKGENYISRLSKGPTLLIC